MQADGARVTVVVPAFNEARRFTQHLGLFEAAVREGSICPRSTEVIVVDDGSTDETAAKAEEVLSPTFPLLRVLQLHNNSGKGAAIRVGTAAATAPVVLFMDADMSIEPSQIPHLVKAIGPADLAIGSRSLAESVVLSNGVQRKVMGRSFNMLVGALTDMPFGDTQCGFKAFRTPLARILFHLLTVQRFAFDVELLCLARRLRMEIGEVAVRWHEVGHSRVRTLTDSVTMTRDVLNVSRRRQWSSIPALAVEPDVNERRRSSSRVVGEISRALGPTFPILLGPDHKPFVLLPLCTPVEVHDMAARLRKLPTRLKVTERSVTFAQLVEAAPFRWIDGERGGLVIASESNVEVMTYPPVGGWESVRTNGRRQEIQLSA